MATDEINDPVMGPPEAESGQQRIGLAGEVPVGEEQKLHRLTQAGVALQ